LAELLRGWELLVVAAGMALNQLVLLEEVPAAEALAEGIMEAR
jgi:hypothetical protein